MKRVLLILATFSCAGCISVPHRTMIVTDAKQRPLPYVFVNPYPVSLFPWGIGAHGNYTDRKGRVEIYDVNPGHRYSLRADGFQQRSISFPTKDPQAAKPLAWTAPRSLKNQRTSRMKMLRIALQAASENGSPLKLRVGLTSRLPIRASRANHSNLSGILSCTHNAHTTPLNV